MVRECPDDPVCAVAARRLRALRGEQTVPG